jgi:hypothetical protein
VNLKEIRIQEEDLCKECTRPTLRQSVESMKSSEGSKLERQCKFCCEVKLHWQKLRDNARCALTKSFQERSKLCSRTQGRSSHWIIGI